MNTALAPRRANAGFTLIELMIAVAIVAILVSVALPFYRDSIRKSHRSDAFKVISATQLSQERWRSDHTTYSTSLTELVITSPTAEGTYTIAVSAPASPDALDWGYIVTATATGSQADDTRCALLAARVLKGNVTYGAGTSSVDWADPNRCWVR